MEAVDSSRSLSINRLHLGITALNGLMGDRLQAQGNPLAVHMSFYHRNRPLALTADQLAAFSPSVTEKLVVFVHGLASNEQMWAYPPAADGSSDERLSYGSLLSRDHGFTPLYLRYNSGLRVSHNGRLLAALLEELLQIYPQSVSQLVLIGHSLGGLVIRSACHYGEQAGHSWTSTLDRVIYIGTPHDGVPWEALTAPLYGRLALSGNSLGRTIYKFYQSRSAAMRDVVDVALIDEHWQEGNNHQQPLPWFSGAEHYFIAGSINQNPSHILSQAFGDVLVPIGSAKARTAIHEHFPEPPMLRERSVVVPAVKHIALAHHPEVYAHLARWLNE